MANGDGERLETWEQRLLDQLRELGQVADPVPAEVAFAAKGSFAWRRIDAELAELTFDSLLDEAAGAGVRSGTAVRLVTFEAPGLSVEVEVTASGDGRRLIGQLVPPQAGRLDVRTSSGTTGVDADELGRFTVDGLATGPVSLRCALESPARVVETGWVVL